MPEFNSATLLIIIAVGVVLANPQALLRSRARDVRKTRASKEPEAI